MKSIESTGKTVKEAIERGAAQLGCKQEDLEVKIIEMGTSGIFGLFGKPAKVFLTLREKEDEEEFKMPLFTLEQAADKKKDKKAKKTEKKAVKEEKSEPVVEEPVKAVEEDTAAETAEETAEGEAKPKRRRRRSRSKNKGTNTNAVVETEEVETVAAPTVEAEPFVETPEEELSDSAKKAREFLTGLTERMNVPISTAICEKEGQIRINMSGENMSILIGRRGDTLDGLQYLTSLVVNRDHDDYIRVSLDTENYRAKREEALRKLAIRMANRCKKSGRRVALEPMNPYERRILHSTLQADPVVMTHSEGEEPYRRVIITMK